MDFISGIVLFWLLLALAALIRGAAFARLCAWFLTLGAAVGIVAVWAALNPLMVRSINHLSWLIVALIGTLISAAAGLFTALIRTFAQTASSDSAGASTPVVSTWQQARHHVRNILLAHSNEPDQWSITGPDQEGCGLAIIIFVLSVGLTFLVRVSFWLGIWLVDRLTPPAFKTSSSTWPTQLLLYSSVTLVLGGIYGLLHFVGTGRL